MSGASPDSMRKIFLAACTTLFCAGAAFSGTITYNAIGTASGNGELENASATFITSLNSITVSLSNFLANPNDAGQLFSGITFTLSLAPVSNPSLTSSSGTELTITSNSVGGYSIGSAQPAGWGFSFSGATLTLNDLVVGSSPKHTVIGPSNNGTYSGGAYSSANASLKGNHNPFLKDATFTIMAPGVTTLTTVTGATFMFGTAAGNNIVGVPAAAVSEPATVSFLVLAGAGLCGRALMKRKSRNS